MIWNPSTLVAVSECKQEFKPNNCIETTAVASSQAIQGQCCQPIGQNEAMVLNKTFHNICYICTDLPSVQSMPKMVSANKLPAMIQRDRIKELSYPMVTTRPKSTVNGLKVAVWASMTPAHFYCMYVLQFMHVNKWGFTCNSPRPKRLSRLLFLMQNS